MTDSGRTLNGKSVYVAEFTTTQDTGDIPYGGIYTLQIQAYSGETHKGQVVPIQNYWTSLGVFNGKLWDGSNWVDFIPDVVSLAGTELKFVDMTQELSEGSVTAVFRTDNNQSNTYTINGTFRVPEDYNGTEEYTEVQLNINNQSTQWYSLKELVQEENTCYYYGVTELPSGELISRWAAETTGNESISGRTLYFYSGKFSLNDTIIIAGKEEKISERYIGSVNTLYYKIPDDISADQETIITVVHESTTYHFMWKDLTKNKVAVSDNVAEVSGIQPSEKTGYIDATLPKLYYGISKTNSSGGADNTPGETPGKASGNAIPASEDGNVYYWMRKDQSDSGQKGGGKMAKRESYESRVEAYLLPLMERHGFELVDVEYVKEAGTWYLRAYIDKEGGIGVDDCEVISRDLSDWLDEEDFIDDSYVLEVSSPGLDRPLKKEKDYIRSMGRDVDVRLYRAVDKQKEFTGALTAYDDTTVTLTMEDGSQRVFDKKDIALIRLALDF